MNDLFNLAGLISSAMFILGQLPMLHKAFKTRDLKSYSLTNFVMAMAGNTLYWVYLLCLPVGPVWLLHGFNTLCTGLMLFLYLRYGPGIKLIMLKKAS